MFRTSLHSFAMRRGMRNAPLVSLNFVRFQTGGGNSSSPSPSSRGIKTAVNEAIEAEAKCAALREKIEQITCECAELQDRLDRSAEEKSRLRSAARTLTGEEDGGDVFEDTSSMRAGFAGGKEDDGFMVDPRRVMRVHKCRSSGSISQLTAVVGSNVKDIVGQANVVTIVGTVVEEPVYGYVGGAALETQKQAGGKQLRTVVRTAKKDVGGGEGLDSTTTTTTTSTPSTPSTSATSGDGDVKKGEPSPSAESALQASMLAALEGQLSPQPTRVMQLTVRQLGCRTTGYPSPSRTFMNTFTVQCRAPYDGLLITKGQRVTIIGHYGVHAVFQLDTTQWQLNPVVDVGPSGFIGVL